MPNVALQNFALLMPKCGVARIYGLRLGFSNSIWSSFTSVCQYKNVDR